MSGYAFISQNPAAAIANNNAVNQYKEQQILTASREELLILMFEGAIRFLKLGRRAIEKKDIEGAHKNLIKTQHIIAELQHSLDLEIGGETAHNLSRLYQYLYFRLVTANIKKDLDIIDEVLGHLKDLKNTWEEAIKIAQAQQQQPEEALSTSERVS